MNSLKPIYTKEIECQDCYKCVRQCLVKAIKIENGHAKVMYDYCVACGHCVEVCPVGAKKIRNDIDRVKLLLKRKDKVIVSLAPSFISEFKGIAQESLLAAFKELGFYGVSETALGAEEVSANVSALLKKDGNNIYISSACPVVVDYIKKYFPQYTNYISNFLSPVLAHCKILKKAYGDDISIVFVGPCIAKKNEADAHQDLLDIAITFSDIKNWFNEQNITLNEIITDGTDTFIPAAAHEGALYPIDGGMIAGVQRNCKIDDGSFMTFSGIKNIETTLSGIDELHHNGNLFIEMLACEGGCINGPASNERKKTIAKRIAVIDYAKQNGYGETKQPAFNISNKFIEENLTAPEFTDSEIRKTLESIGKYSLQDELNCGGCGYDSCRDFAKALLSGKAETMMCVSYMRKLAQKKATALIKTMPSGVVIADETLHVLESNKKFAKILSLDLQYDAKPGLEGLNLNKVIPFLNLFKSVLESGEDIIEKNVKYKDIVLRISIFTIEKHRLIGGIFQDITAPAVQREQIIQKTQEVIQKNLSTVQQIAYLLGENASETEITLNSIIDAFKPKQIEQIRSNDNE